MLSPQRLSTREAIFNIPKEAIKNIEPIPPRRGGIPGQHRALGALEMGLAIRNRGYNVFVTGQEGTGRRTAIYNILRELSPPPPVQKDVVLVHNFKHQEHPRPLYFKKGEAKQFQGKLRGFIERIRQDPVRKPRGAGGSNGKTQIADHPELFRELEKLKDGYAEPRIHTYLETLAENILQNSGVLLPEASRRDNPRTKLPPWCELNILEDRGSQETVPIVYEKYPTYQNLFGFICPPPSRGEGNSQTTHLDVKGGSILRASGGFLLLDAEDLLKEKRSWKYLQQTLRTGLLTILPGATQPPGGGQNIIPKDIEVDVKVILIGSESCYDNFLTQDSEFSSLFKISADFDNVMPRTTEAMGAYIYFIDTLGPKAGVRPLDLEGKAEVIRHGTRLAEDRSKLSTCFNEILDLLVEAEYWSRRRDAPMITGEIVQETLEKRHYRSNLAEEKINELIADGDIYIPLGDPKVGQINALAIYERGRFSFGTPCLISAKTSPGDTGIINIDGEVGLSGEIHDKWIYILEGYLRHNYTSRFPLTLYATLCFEQSYGEIDGDSAATAEMCALLSSISEVPLRQTIAVTGSLSQTGMVQPVGGITEKVEGFYSVCSQAGLTGEQGVILPRHNVKNLILPRKVEAALDKELFHLYPVETLNEALEILSGIPAGIRNPRGNYPTGTFNALVEKRLKQLYSQVKSGGD